MSEAVKITLVIAAALVSCAALWFDQASTAVVVFGGTLLILYRDRKMI